MSGSWTWEEMQASAQQAPAAATPTQGMVTPGTVDLTTRPTVPMPDGSIATVRSMSFNDGEGREVLIPTISDDGRLLSDDDAVALYRQSGRHLGIFATPDDATAYAKQLSQQQGRDYGAKAPPATWTWEEMMAPKQSLPAALGNTAMSSLIGTVGLGVAAPSRMIQAADKGYANTMLRAVETLASDQGAAYRPLTPVQRSVLTAYRHATPERQAELQAEWQSALTQGTPAMVERGAAISQYGRDKFPVDPAQQGDLTNAVGMVASLPAALVAGGLGAAVGGPAGGFAGMTSVIYAQAYESTYQEAIEKGATPEKAAEVASKNAGAQALLNFVPLARVIGRIPAGFRDEFIKTVAKYGQSSLEFGTANALGRFIKNFIYQKEIDPKQSLTEGVWDDTKAGLLVGPFMLGSAAAGRGAGRVAREQLGPAASPEVRRSLNQIERLADEAQPTIAPEAAAVDGLPPDAPGGEPSTPAQGSMPLPFNPDMPTMRITPEPGDVAPVRPEAAPDGVPEGPVQDVLPADLGRPADDVAPAPDAVFPEPVEAGALPPMGDPKRPPKPPSLFDFLISKGGIRPDDDLLAIGLDTVHHQRAGRLLNKKGAKADMAREAAVEAGYLPPDATLADFYDALAEENAGRPVYPPEYATEVGQWEQGRAADRERIRGEELAAEARAAAEESGVRLTPDEEMHAARLMVEGARPEEAVYEAVRASDIERGLALDKARGMLSAREKGQADQRAQGAPSPEAGRARQELAVVMQRLMRLAGLPSSVGLRLVDRIVYPDGTAADGVYLKSLITYALDTRPSDAPTKLFHEVTHALMDPQLGVLTPTQRNALMRAADRWLDQGKNRQMLTDLGYAPENIRAEAVARVAEEVVTKARREAPITTRAVEAMNRAVEAIGSGLRGQGFWSADGVFRAVMQGRVKGEGKGGADGPRLSRRPLPEGLDPRLPASGGLSEGVEKRNVGILSPEATANAARYTSPEGREYGALLDAQRQAWGRVDYLRPIVEDSKAQLREPGLTDRGAERKYGTLQRAQARLADAEASALALGLAPDAAFPRDVRMDVPFGEFPGDNKYAHETYAPEGYPFPDLNVPEDKRHQYHDPRHRVRQGDASAGGSPQYARRPPKPPPSGPDLFGGERREPEQRAAVPTFRTDPRQEAMPGMEPSAVQAQAARDATGRGGLEPRVPQARPDEGLFGREAPEEGSLLSRRRPASQNNLNLARSAWEIEDPSMVDSFVRTLQDNKVDLKKVQKRITDLYGPIAEGRDAYAKEELYHGRVSSRVQRLHDQRVKPILRQIADNREGVTVDDVDRYLLARHAPERNAAMKAINPDRVDNEALSGMSDADAAAAMQAFASESKLNRLEDIAKDVDKLTADTRKVIKAEGLETADTIKAWEDAYQFYAPLQRDIEGNGAPRGSGFNVRGPESKRAMGSTLEVKNILANIVAQAETAAIRAEKNKVTTALADLAKQYPADGFWKVDEVPTTRQINKSTGLVETIPDPVYQLADNVVMYKEGGKHHFIKFDENNKRAVEVARAMKNMDAGGLSQVMRMATVPTRFLASLLTRWNPEFWVTNFIRDVGGTQYNWFGTGLKEGRRDVIANVPKAMRGLRDLYRGEGNSEWAGYAKEMDAAGGTTGHMDMYETSDKRMDNLRSEVAKMEQGAGDPRRIARTVLQAVDDYNSIVENSVRLAAFQAARKQGLSPQRAASIAKNITVNFNRKGNASAGINAWFMFFNASVQGTATILKAAAKSPKARAVLGGMAATGFLLDMVNREVMGDDYEAIPDFEKSHNAIFAKSDGTYVKVPYPLGLNAVFNVGRLTSEAISGRSHKKPIEYGMSMAAAMLDAFNPMGSVGGAGELFSPSIARPVVQLADNRSFTGAPVFKSGDRGPRGDAPEPAHRRHFQNTPEMWIAASRGMNALTGGDYAEKGAVNVSPDALRHIFTSMTGGLGRAADRTLDYFTSDEPSASRMPFVGRVVGKVDDRMKERAFMGESKIINTAINEVDFLLKSGRPDAADDIIKKLGKGNLDEGFRVLGYYRAAKKELDTLRRKGSKTTMQEPDDETTAIGRMMRDMRRQTMDRALREGRP